MIYTVTFSPSLDYIVELEGYLPGAVNRTSNEQILTGGKGINVSIVLNNLGYQSTALGFVAGFTGDEIERDMKSKGIRTDFIHLTDGFSRINVKIKSAEESEINGQGPKISINNIETLYQKLEKLQSDDVLVLAGSIPLTLPETIYMDILERVSSKNIKIVVDATGNLLVNVLKYHPFLIKPNKIELAEIFDTEISSKESVIENALKLKELGARNVLVSMAGEGAILIGEDGKVYESAAPKGNLVNSVGAGDSMVAGFIAGYLDKENYQHSLKMGIATGSASAFSKYLATKDEVLEVFRSI